MTEAHFTIFVSSLPPEKSDGYFLSFSLGAGVDGSKADETRSQRSETIILHFFFIRPMTFFMLECEEVLM